MWTTVWVRAAAITCYTVLGAVLVLFHALWTAHRRYPDNTPAALSCRRRRNPAFFARVLTRCLLIHAAGYVVTVCWLCVLVCTFGDLTASDRWFAWRSWLPDYRLDSIHRTPPLRTTAARWIPVARTNARTSCTADLCLTPVTFPRRCCRRVPATVTCRLD